MAVGAGRIFAINLLANSKPAENAFDRVGKAAGRLPTPMKIAAAALTAVFAAVTAVAVKSFKELLKLGEEFNEVTRIISVGTGAVGGDLAALEQSFREVARSVPNAFAEVATVIAELDTRTDLAGEGLEAMAEQMLTLARLTRGDVRNTTREVTRLFNRFGLSAEDASDMLDLLFRASQASGAEVDRLAADVTKNAGALQAMGLSLEESIALIALFEREGVRTRTVVSALQTGFLKLTKDGALPLNEALAETFTELQTLDREAAVARGLEIFGTSALELVDAVRDGRLSIEDFTKQIVDGESSIIGVAEQTDGWRQKLDEVRNNLKLAFEPAARAVFKNVTDFVEELIPAAQRVADAFERDGLQGALAQVAKEWDRIYTEQLQPLFIRLLAFLQETVKPFALEIGKEIGGAIASGMFSAFKAGVSNLFGSKMGDRILGGADLGNFKLAPAPGVNLSGLVPNLPAMGGGATANFSGVRGGATQALRIMNADISNLSAQLANLPRMAAGGVVTGPTLALIGEAGPEAVIPLSRGGGMGGNIIVNVTGTMMDPEGVAREVVKVLNDAQRRSGSGASRFV